jgi:hypothetical protein
MVSNNMESVSGSYIRRSPFDAILLVCVLADGFNKLVKNLLAIVDIRLSESSLLEISIVS